ncbi:MAG: hypothetical protein ABJL99_12195 [Aliishimia sp.]
MSENSRDLAKARALQADLLQLTTKLGKLIAAPASQRDTDAATVLWNDIKRLHAPLNSIYRRLRKSTRDSDKSDAQREAQSEVRNLNRCLRIWDQMDDMIWRHITPEASELQMHRTHTKADETLSFLHAALHLLANPNSQDQDAVDHNCFADIPMGIQLFDLLLSAAYRLLLVQGRADKARFLDVGCGGGTKVLAASRVFPKCDGLEYDQGYAEAGKRTLQLTAPETGQVIHGDALTFDAYADYDVIYFYRPISDDDLLSQMQNRIIEQARLGTIILAPYTKFLEPRKDFPCARITGPVFVTGMSQEDADLWHQNAEHTDTDLIRRKRHMRFDPEFWTPIVEAASYNGVSAT